MPCALTNTFPISPSGSLVEFICGSWEFSGCNMNSVALSPELHDGHDNSNAIVKPYGSQNHTNHFSIFVHNQVQVQ